MSISPIRQALYLAIPLLAKPAAIAYV